MGGDAVEDDELEPPTCTWDLPAVLFPNTLTPFVLLEDDEDDDKIEAPPARGDDPSSGFCFSCSFPSSTSFMT